MVGVKSCSSQNAHSHVFESQLCKLEEIVMSHCTCLQLRPSRLSSVSGHRSLANPPVARIVCASASYSASQQVDNSKDTFKAMATGTLCGLLFCCMPSPSLAYGGDFMFTSTPQEGDVEDEYFETVPQSLSASDQEKTPRLGSLIEGAQGKKVQQCARKCVPTCIRGGQGGPGLGQLAVRRETSGVVLKEGYRSRKYCLSECVVICALEIKNEVKAK